jgi:hypothetical protein
MIWLNNFRVGAKQQSLTQLVPDNVILCNLTQTIHYVNDNQYILYTFVPRVKYKMYVKSNLYQEVTFGTKKTSPYKTGDLLKEVQFI